MKPEHTNCDSNSKTSTSKFLAIRSLFLFLVFPLSHVANIFLVHEEIQTLYGLSSSAVFSFALTILFFLILVSYVIQKQYSKKQTTRNYSELLTIQQYQKKHYETIQSQREQLEQLKNLFSSEIYSVSQFLNNGQPDKAMAQLNKLTSNLETTKEYPFCPNPVINAVLSDKERICRKNNIALYVNLQLGLCNTIDQIHLCCIFSNLMDNALEASMKIEQEESRYIHLTAKQSGDYLHIKVKNSSLAPTPAKEGRGYGQKILKDIAEKYSGTFRTHYENNVYEAYLSIQMP